jgi:cyclic lactone autoinducer peptide
MRWLLKLFLFCLATIAILLAATASWFFLYSGDLPDVARLAEFAPASNTSVSDPCLETASIAIPSESLGANLRNALGAAEVRLPVQISRTMFCGPSKAFKRQLDEMRTAARIERRYSRSELLTIYANRTSFGQGLIGVQNASRYFFRKNADDLSIAEAALLAGLVEGPSYLSPLKHPDRALIRRNEVLDAMLQAGAITAPEAETEKNAPLGVAVNAASPRAQ